MLHHPAAAATDSSEASYAVADRLLAQVDSLPTLADVPLRVLALLDTKEEVALAEIASELEHDPVLVTRVLRLARSPLFAGDVPIESVTKAVVRLGIGEIRTLVVTVAFADAVEFDSRVFDMREMFREAVCCGSVARQLAIDLDRGQPAVAYLAGLLHSMGQIALGLCLAPRFEAAIHAARQRLASIEEALEREFGVPPALVGARLLKRWHVPEAVVDAVEHQNRPEASTRSDSLASIVATARKTVRALGIGIEWPGDSARDWTAEALPLLASAHSGGDAHAYLEARHADLAGVDATLSALLPTATFHRTALLS